MQIVIQTYVPVFRFDRDVQQEIVQYRNADTGRVALQIPAALTVRTLREATSNPVAAAVLEMLPPIPGVMPPTRTARQAAITPSPAPRSPAAKVSIKV